MTRPPGPRGLKIIGNIEAFEEDRLGFLLDCRDKYGDVVRFSDRVTIIFGADLVNEVLVNTNSTYAITDNFLLEEVSTDLVGKWMHARSMLNVGLRASVVRRFADEVATLALAQLSTISGTAPVDVVQLMENITAPSIARFFFGADDAEPIPRLSTELLDALVKVIGNPVVLPAKLPTPTRIRIWRRLARLNAVVERRVAERREHPADYDDLAGVLIQLRGTDETPTDAQLAKMIIGSLLAAHRVPAAALGWMWYLIGQHPQVAARARAELAAHGDNPTAGDQLAELTYCDSVVKETLRLYPATWLMTRRVMADTQLGGFELPRGQTLLFSPYVLHRDPAVFPDPLAFRPERWLPGHRPEGGKHAYIPFGSGPRACPGASFARMSMLTILATLLPKWDLALPPNTVVTPNPRTTLLPDGLSMTATLIDPTAHSDRLSTTSAPVAAERA